MPNQHFSILPQQACRRTRSRGMPARPSLIAAICRSSCCRNARSSIAGALHRQVGCIDLRHMPRFVDPPVLVDERHPCRPRGRQEQGTLANPPVRADAGHHQAIQFLLVEFVTQAKMLCLRVRMKAWEMDRMPQRNVAPSDCVSMSASTGQTGANPLITQMQAHGDAGCYCDKPFEHIYRRLLSRLLQHNVVEIRACRASSSLAALSYRSQSRF